MLMVISPAKTLDFDSPLATTKNSQPRFLDQSQQLINELQKLAPHDISNLMSVSDKIGTLNFDRFQTWQQPFNDDNARAAVLAFKGDVYTGMQVQSFKASDFTFAQKHLRILSGLYGLLRPLDLMQAYRLEMGTKFANQGGKNLYEFWDNKITEVLNQDIKGSGNKVLVNLASNEYFKSVQLKQLDSDVITPVFKDFKNGKYKIISFYAKKARGMMAAYIIKNKIKSVEDIKEFDVDGYSFNGEMTSGADWVFTREEQ
ncbi:MAG: peroxide stress protein YaaA [Sinobacterium sp.]|jgi:cytoplasmic iron level regulating protein YaaA (DUF328/UPF0246 family)|tara:strand:- start:26 stop:799 length:774 start_codon:yes stop_codon:yes gene_type:complete